MASVTRPWISTEWMDWTSRILSSNAPCSFSRESTPSAIPFSQSKPFFRASAFTAFLPFPLSFDQALQKALHQRAHFRIGIRQVVRREHFRRIPPESDDAVIALVGGYDVHRFRGRQDGQGDLLVRFLAPVGADSGRARIDQGVDHRPLDRVKAGYLVVFETDIVQGSHDMGNGALAGLARARLVVLEKRAAPRVEKRLFGRRGALEGYRYLPLRLHPDLFPATEIHQEYRPAHLVERLGTRKLADEKIVLDGHRAHGAQRQRPADRLFDYVPVDSRGKESPGRQCAFLPERIEIEQAGCDEEDDPPAHPGFRLPLEPFRDGPVVPDLVAGDLDVLPVRDEDPAGRDGGGAVPFDHVFDDRDVLADPQGDPAEPLFRKRLPEIVVQRSLQAPSDVVPPDGELVYWIAVRFQEIPNRRPLRRDSRILPEDGTGRGRSLRRHSDPGKAHVEDPVSFDPDVAKERRAFPEIPSFRIDLGLRYHDLFDLRFRILVRFSRLDSRGHRLDRVISRRQVHDPKRSVPLGHDVPAFPRLFGRHANADSRGRGFLGPDDPVENSAAVRQGDSLSTSASRLRLFRLPRGFVRSPQRDSVPGAPLNFVLPDHDPHRAAADLDPSQCL